MQRLLDCGGEPRVTCRVAGHDQHSRVRVLRRDLLCQLLAVILDGWGDIGPESLS